MSTYAGVWLVKAAFQEIAGDKAAELMECRTTALDNLTPLEVAREPGGACIVLAELDAIVKQAMRRG